MVGAAHADPRHAGLARDLDREIGGIGHHQVTHAVVAVDQRGGRAALEHLDVGARIEDAGLELLDVTRQPENAVRIRAREVGIEHRAGDGPGVSLRQPAGLQRIGHVGADGSRRHAAGIGIVIGHGMGTSMCSLVPAHPTPSP